MKSAVPYRKIAGVGVLKTLLIFLAHIQTLEYIYVIPSIEKRRTSATKPSTGYQQAHQIPSDLSSPVSISPLFLNPFQQRGHSLPPIAPKPPNPRPFPPPSSSPPAYYPRNIPLLQIPLLAPQAPQRMTNDLRPDPALLRFGALQR